VELFFADFGGCGAFPKIVDFLTEFFYGGWLFRTVGEFRAGA